MKRTRDDMHTDAQRPAESSGQPQMISGEGTKKLPITDISTYLNAIKDRFQNSRAKHNQFIDIMRDYKTQRTDTDGVIDRVKDLFRGHQDLILGFNAFLPKGYEITLPPEDKSVPVKKPAEFEEAMNFVNKIKTRFQGDDHVYKSFIDVLNMYRIENKSITEVYEEVSFIFRQHPDLLMEFTHFLPDSSEIATLPSDPSGRNSIFHHEERSSPVPTMKHMPVDKKPTAPHIERDHGFVQPDLDCDKSLFRGDKEQKRRSEREKEKRDERDSRDMDVDDRYFEQGETFYTNQPKSVRRRDNSTNGQLHPKGVKNNYGIDKGSPSSDEKNELKRIYSQEFAFCEKVKDRLNSTDGYQDFLNFLQNYSGRLITRSKFKIRVTDLLSAHPDLIVGFNEFLSRCEKIDGFVSVADDLNKGSVLSERSKSINAEESDRDQDCERDDRDKCRNAENRERDKSERVFNNKDVTGRKISLSKKDKYLEKPIYELDLSNCESCTPSYRLLPKDYPVHLGSMMTEIDAEVLNDQWVSVTSGSEDYSFKHMRKNQYEESLFRCEDDRFEMDMLISSVNATTKRVEDLLEKINNNSISDRNFSVAEQFTVHNLRCIERIYGDHGLDIMDVLKKNAPLALPILLTRLKQKHKEWTRCRAEFNKVWADIYIKNYDRSLDHRSFYFKQQDSKNLSKKALLNEIIEIRDMKRKEDDFLLAAVSGNKTHVPHMEFEYSDLGIHEDIYQLVKYSCREICTDDDLEKVMKIWTNFIEPMFEVPSRPQQTDANKNFLKSENQKNGNCVIGENHNIADDAVAITVKSNHSRNSDGSALLEQSTSFCQVGLAKACNGFKDETSSDVNHTLQKKSDVFCSNPLHATSLSSNVVQDSLSGPIKLAISIQQLDDSRLLPIARADQSFREGNVDNASGVCGAMNIFNNPTSLKGIHCDKISPSSDVTDCKRLPSSANSLPVQQAKSQSPENLKPEKEEGELYPNQDSEEDNFTSYGNDSEEGAHGPKDSAGYREVLEETCRSRGWGIDADADEDGEFTVHKSSDSENDDASASQSSDGKVYSQENQGEYGDHNEDEKKAEKECEAEKIGTLSECMLQNVKPLKEHVSPASCGKNGDSRIFYGSDSFYVLFRLHQLLYSRIKSAKINSSTGEHKWRGSTDTSPTDLYARFMSAVYHLLDGSFDNTKFEDDCRAILGTQSYVLFTLDKLIFKIVKQLKIIAAKEKDNILLQLYEYERSRKPGNFVDFVYWENACVLLHDESIFRIECSNIPTQMFIELMENRRPKTEMKGMPMDTSFAAYLQNELFLSLVPKRSDESNIFLRRNKRRNESGNEFSMKGVQIVNGLEYKISCSSSKISYVLDTEDLLFRSGMKRREL